MKPVPREDYIQLIRAALAEDIGGGDATTLAVIPPGSRARARMMARTAMVVAGIPLATAVFKEVDPTLTMGGAVNDGDHVQAECCLLEISGSAAAILTAERTALNLIQRLSGIATLTARFVEAVKGTQTQILDTRKTTPCLRVFEKYAVACGGGTNHRVGLHDMIMMKDNHLAVLAQTSAEPIAEAVRRARTKYPQLRVEVETDHLDQVRQAAAAGADVILLDNMTLDQLREAVAIVGGRCKTEASGGVKLETVRDIAGTGVDFISVGALTHSAPAVDIGLDFEPTQPS